MCVQALKEDHKGIALLQQWEVQAQAAIHSQQSETLKTILKYYQEFYLLNIVLITSLLHTHDLSLYVWVQIDAISIHTTEVTWVL